MVAHPLQVAPQVATRSKLGRPDSTLACGTPSCPSGEAAIPRAKVGAAGACRGSDREGWRGAASRHNDCVFLCVYVYAISSRKAHLSVWRDLHQVGARLGVVDRDVWTAGSFRSHGSWCVAWRPAQRTTSATVAQGRGGLLRKHGSGSRGAWTVYVKGRGRQAEECVPQRAPLMGPGEAADGMDDRVASSLFLPCVAATGSHRLDANIGECRTK